MTLEAIDRDHLSAATGGRLLDGQALEAQIRARVQSKMDALTTRLQQRLGKILPMSTMETASPEDAGAEMTAPQTASDRRLDPRQDP